MMEMLDKTSKEPLIQTSFLLSKNLHKELKKIALREDRDMRDILIEQIEQYVKNHGEGNPNFPMTKWIDDPEFWVTPTLKTPFDKWNKYLDHCTEKELVDLKDYSEHVFCGCEKRLKK